MHGHDIIVMGASAGGLEAIKTIVAGLPPTLPAAIFVVVHMSPQAPGMLPRILARASTLPAVAADGQAIRHGRIYVAVPDHHLLLERGRVQVVRGPKENGSRPAVDPLFRSAARSYGPRVIGIVLSGALDDGTAGLHAIKRMGGVAIVQDPKDALVPSMPSSALDYVEVDHCVPARDIAALLASLTGAPTAAGGGWHVPEDIEWESRIAALDPSALQRADRPGQISSFTCPECHGPLWEMRDGGLMRFRCRVGHAYSRESLLAGQAESVEDALWMAANTLEESAQVAARLAQEAREHNNSRAAQQLEERAREKMSNVEVLRRVLANGSTQAVEAAETLTVDDAEAGEKTGR